MTNTTLDQQLAALTQQALAERRLVMGAREAERRNIVEIYQWWRSAIAQPGYLEQLYQPFEYLKRREVVKAGINFDRLLYLVYGLEGLTKDDRYNKTVVLNRIHAEFESSPQAYENDTSDKLAAWIVARGGMTSLARSKSDSDADDDDEDDAPQGNAGGSSAASGGSSANTSQASSQASAAAVPPHPHASSAAALATEETPNTLRQAALDFYFGAHAEAAAGPSYQLEHRDGELDLAQITAAGKRYVAQGVSGSALQEVFTEAYQCAYQDLPPVLASVYEVLCTQAPSIALREPLQRLKQRAVDKRQGSGARMLVYRAHHNQLVLAPCSTAYGVVTIATLKQRAFGDAQQDLMLSHFARRWVEQQILMLTQAKRYRLDTEQHSQAVHTYKLQHDTDAVRWSFLDFWQVERNHPRVVIYNLTDSEPVLARVTLDFTQFQRWVHQHVDAWIHGYSRHLTREYNQQIQFSIQADKLAVDFDLKDGAYTASGEFDLAQHDARSGAAAVTLNSQDFYITMSAVARISSMQPVQISWYAQHCQIRVQGDIADYEIVIPALDAAGYRTSHCAEPLAFDGMPSWDADDREYLEFDDDMRVEFPQELLDDTAVLFDE